MKESPPSYMVYTFEDDSIIFILKSIININQIKNDILYIEKHSALKSYPLDELLRKTSHKSYIFTDCDIEHFASKDFKLVISFVRFDPMQPYKKKNTIYRFAKKHPPIPIIKIELNISHCFLYLDCDVLMSVKTSKKKRVTRDMFNEYIEIRRKYIPKNKRLNMFMGKQLSTRIKWWEYYDQFFNSNTSYPIIKPLLPFRNYLTGGIVETFKDFKALRLKGLSGIMNKDISIIDMTVFDECGTLPLFDFSKLNVRSDMNTIIDRKLLSIIYGVHESYIPKDYARRNEKDVSNLNEMLPCFFLESCLNVFKKIKKIV